MTVLIGLHGQRGSGKDTAFRYAHEWATERGVSAGRRGFADALKLSFARLFIPNISLGEAIDWCNRIKEGGTLWIEDEVAYPDQTSTLTHEISGRVALQRYGTEGHRDVFGSDFWVDALLPRGGGWPMNFSGEMDFSMEPPEICAVTDVRFENEAERIRELGGIIIKIDRSVGDPDNHVSEFPLPNRLIDFVIENNTTLTVFREDVRAFMDAQYGTKFAEVVEG